MTARKLRFFTRLTLISCGGTAILSGCDPLLRGTTENGIINLSTSFLAAFFQAAIQVFQETA